MCNYVSVKFWVLWPSIICTLSLLWKLCSSFVAFQYLNLWKCVFSLFGLAIFFSILLNLWFFRRKFTNVVQSAQDSERLTLNPSLTIKLCNLKVFLPALAKFWNSYCEFCSFSFFPFFSYCPAVDIYHSFGKKKTKACAAPSAKAFFK